MRRLGVVVAISLFAGCGDDVVEVVPDCEDVSWPLGVEPVAPLPAPEFAVECAEGWGNAVATRPAIETVALPGGGWLAAPQPGGGWVWVILPEYFPGWIPWLEAEGVDPASLPAWHGMLRIDADGRLDWAVPEYTIWWFDFVGDELWALGRDDDDVEWLLAFDPDSGELLGARAWDLGPKYNLIEAADDPAGGAWITGIESHEQDELVDQTLYRAVTLDAVELIATRTTVDPRQAPSGGIEALDDGGAIWWTGLGFEIIEPDGSVRWSHPDARAAVGRGDSMLVISEIPTGFGNGRALRLEGVALADGATLWTHEHRRFVLAEPERCGPDDCALMDFAWPMLRPDGGYLLLGGHAYPSSSCAWQPLIMAVSATGEAEWVHRVETCGRAFRAAFRDDGRLEVLGVTGRTDDLAWIGAWTRWIEL